MPGLTEAQKQYAREHPVSKDDFIRLMEEKDRDDKLEKCLTLGYRL